MPFNKYDFKRERRTYIMTSTRNYDNNIIFTYTEKKKKKKKKPKKEKRERKKEEKKNQLKLKKFQRYELVKG